MNSVKPPPELGIQRVAGVAIDGRGPVLSGGGAAPSPPPESVGFGIVGQQVRRARLTSHVLCVPRSLCLRVMHFS